MRRRIAERGRLEGEFRLRSGLAYEWPVELLAFGCLETTELLVAQHPGMAAASSAASGPRSAAWFGTLDPAMAVRRPRIASPTPEAKAAANPDGGVGRVANGLGRRCPAAAQRNAFAPTGLVGIAVDMPTMMKTVIGSRAAPDAKAP